VILEAARAAFAEKGYGATGVRDIVRRTDLAPGTFYNYFPDKEAIFLALVEESIGSIRVRLRSARQEAGSLEEFVCGAYHAYFTGVAEDPAMFELLRRNAGTVRTMLDDPLLAAGVDELAQHRLLVGEVVVERAGRQPGRAHDVAHARRAEADVAEHAAGAAEDRLAVGLLGRLALGGRGPAGDGPHAGWRSAARRAPALRSLSRA
jgi:AcrR family transcriptional regulator